MQFQKNYAHSIIYKYNKIEMFWLANCTPEEIFRLLKCPYSKAQWSAKLVYHNIVYIL